MRLFGSVLVMALCFGAGSARGAEPVYLELEIGGEAIEGDSTVESLERENTIECLSYKDSVTTSTGGSAGRISGRRQYGPVVCTKRIDRSSPRIAQALAQNEQITEAKFRFFRTGDAGADEHFYTVKLAEGRISGITTVSPNTLDPSTASRPATEEIGIIFQTITRTFENPTIEFEDNVRTE